mmetsp:Transcript_12947/g.15703  ORF Transcript_12947/g.15703 Transcript_12947/m.15703 type:complete len:233 (+) Transcript_12947:334-1032(+)
MMSSLIHTEKTTLGTRLKLLLVDGMRTGKTIYGGQRKRKLVAVTVTVIAKKTRLDGSMERRESEAKKRKSRRKKRRRRKKKKRRKDRDLERNEKDDEIKQLKKLEEDMMAQALGLKPKDEDPGRVKQLDANEMKELLKKGNNGQSEEDGRRIRGLGSGFSKRHEFVPSELRKRGNAATFSLETSVTDSLDSESKNRRREPDLEAEKKGKKQRKKSKHKAKKSRKSERYDSSD